MIPYRVVKLNTKLKRILNCFERLAERLNDINSIAENSSVCFLFGGGEGRGICHENSLDLDFFSHVTIAIIHIKFSMLRDI